MKTKISLKEPSLYFLLFFYMSILTNVQAQGVAVMDQTINPGGVLDELPLPKPSLEGTFYLDNEWKEGYVILSNGDSIGELLLKYDLQNKLLEIKTHEFIKVCPPKLLDEFYIFEPLYNVKNYKNITAYDKSKIGIIEIKYENGNYILATEPYVYIKEATYVPALDTGSKNNKVIKKARYYFGEGTDLTEFKRSKKSIINLTGEHSAKVEKYLKSNKINLKNDNELIRVMEYYIGLING